MASKLSRLGTEVVFTQPGYTARLSTGYGAAPLVHLQTDDPNHPISVVSQPAGEGFQSVLDTGNDWTQSSANGIDGNRIKRLDQFGDEYYGREEIFLQDRDGHEATYQAAMHGPAFWISVDPEDDVIPPDPRGENRWSTAYHDVLQLGKPHYFQIGTPIYFAGTSQVFSGILMLGDSIQYQYHPEKPWWQKVARVEHGHVAFRQRISMKDLSGEGLAAFFFGIETVLDENSDINTVYNGPWSGVFVNSHGGVAFHDRSSATQFVPNGDSTSLNALRTLDGMLLEIRTYGTNEVRIYVEGLLRGTFIRTCFGPYVALFGSCSAGRIAFRHRELFDMGSQFVCQYRTTPRNTILQQLSVYRCRAPYVIPAYRTNLPVAFVDPTIREITMLWDRQGNEFPVPSDGFTFLSDTGAIYAGRSDGSAGVFCKIHGWTGDDRAHAGVSPMAIALNNFSFQANSSPEPFTHHVIVSEWAPKVRLDLFI